MSYGMSKRNHDSREKTLPASSTAKQPEKKIPQIQPFAVLQSLLVISSNGMFSTVTCSPGPKNRTGRSTTHPVFHYSEWCRHHHRRLADDHVGPGNSAPSCGQQNYLSNVRRSVFLRVDFSTDGTSSPPALNHWVGWGRRDLILPRIRTGARLLQILNLFGLLLKKITRL